MNVIMSALDWFKSLTAGQVLLFAGITGCSYFFTDGYGKFHIPEQLLLIGTVSSMLSVIAGAYFLFLKAKIKGNNKE
jgi:hypothetical protein